MPTKGRHPSHHRQHGAMARLLVSALPLLWHPKALELRKPRLLAFAGYCHGPRAFVATGYHWIVLGPSIRGAVIDSQRSSFEASFAETGCSPRRRLGWSDQGSMVGWPWCFGLASRLVTMAKLWQVGLVVKLVGHLEPSYTEDCGVKYSIGTLCRRI